MALPIPAAPVTIPTFTQDRGPVRVDPVTKSTFNKATGYVVLDQCDQEAYYRLNASININQLGEDCRLINQASASLTMTVPLDVDNVDVNNLALALSAEINAKILELQA